MSQPSLILNVDDDDAGRYVKSRILRLGGYEVIEAPNGTAAKRLIAERSPDLVLLDLMLPDMSGRDLCREIKGNPGTAQIVVLQTSASHIDVKARVDSLDAGADGYLTTPVAPEELVAHVRALLRMRKAERERQSALDALREADRRKDEFLAMLAHELRNPLAPIRNAVEVLRMSEDRSVRERARELVGRQVQHLARLVDDLLEVSRITQRKVVLKKSAVTLASVIEAAVEVVRNNYDALGHTLVVSVPPEAIWLDVDSVRMSQVVGNLLHNAGKFTPRGGRILLSARLLADAIEIRVEDNGTGIAPEMVPTVFDLFSQADRSLDRSQGGLGIGLSLVKGLVEMHGGAVRVHSAGVGKGSAFTISLPLSLVVPAPAPPPAPGGERSQAPRRRVLVVEDNLDSAESMRMFLRGIGHEVCVVNNGREAVEAARKFHPDSVLLDIGLPGLDGFHIARELRTLPETSCAHLIAVSGYGQDSDRKRSAEAGFDLHLVKPVDSAQLAAAIDAGR